MEYTSSSACSQTLLHSIYYSSIPPLPIPKNCQKECSLNFFFYVLLYFRGIIVQVIKQVPVLLFRMNYLFYVFIKGTFMTDLYLLVLSKAFTHLPIHKHCCIPFTIPLFHLFLFPKIVKRNAVLISSFMCFCILGALLYRS